MTSARPAAEIALLLDANCLIYYCQRFDEIVRGVPVSFSHPLSDRVSEYIRPIIDSGRCIGSTSAVLSEIPDKGAEELMDDFIYTPAIRETLVAEGIGCPPPPRILERWQAAFMQKFKKLRHKEWFKEIPFSASEASLQEARAFYASLANEPGMAEHIVRKKQDFPSKEDLGLAICAKQLRIPILSNDSDFTKFIDAWSRFGIEIRPLI
jgi:hypothetical protein